MGRRSEQPEHDAPPLAGVKQGRWHPETLVCAFRGHEAPAARVRDAASVDPLIATADPYGTRFARCLRCDAWLVADPAVADGREPPSLGEIELPQRGKALRDALVLKLIALDRALHSFVFTVIAVGTLLLETHLSPVKRQVQQMVDQAQASVTDTGQGVSHSFVVRTLERVSHLTRHGLLIVFFTATAYAVVEGVEAVGLWRQRRWAEYLTALATAGFLPLEIHELVRKVTPTRIVALVVNLAVLVYLVYAKRLFGVRGGHVVDEATMDAGEVIRPLPGQRLPAASEV
jgi:uncharacterized membrane protein (DUF2068 family)